MLSIALPNINLIISFQGLAHLPSSGAKVELAFLQHQYVTAMLTVQITVMSLAVVRSISINILLYVKNVQNDNVL